MKGATEIPEVEHVPVTISIHAPMKGATLVGTRSVRVVALFQSTLP